MIASQAASTWGFILAHTWIMLAIMHCFSSGSESRIEPSQAAFLQVDWQWLSSDSCVHDTTALTNTSYLLALAQTFLQVFQAIACMLMCNSHASNAQASPATTMQQLSRYVVCSTKEILLGLSLAA